MLFAGGAWYAYQFVGWSAARSVLFFLLAAACTQLRLLCNLLDGLLAIEGGLKTTTGDLYNEVPDRIADILILVGAGRGISQAIPFAEGLGWGCALLAVLTAYVRLLGGSLGFPQDFAGPMAKQHRMFTLTVGTLAAAIEFAARGTMVSLAIALLIILAGSAITFIRRLSRIAKQLQSR
jgi:phosphatidylglycerophosphate synthase